MSNGIGLQSLCLTWIKFKCLMYDFWFEIVSCCLRATRRRCTRVVVSFHLCREREKTSRLTSISDLYIIFGKFSEKSSILTRISINLHCIYLKVLRLMSNGIGLQSLCLTWIKFKCLMYDFWFEIVSCCLRATRRRCTRVVVSFHLCREREKTSRLTSISDL